MLRARAQFRISGHLGKASAIVGKVLQRLLIGTCSCVVFEILRELIVCLSESLGSSLPHKLLHGHILRRGSLVLPAFVGVGLASLMDMEIFGGPHGCLVLRIPRLRDILNDACDLSFVHLGLVVIGLVRSVNRLVDEETFAHLTTSALTSCLAGYAAFVLTGLSAIVLGLGGQFIPVS